MFAAGVLFWGGFNTAMELTNTEEFCVSCHEMKEYVLPEYEKSVHYKNRSGVRATCSDCHVPRPWARMFIRKITASNELLHKVLGVIDTKEKFDAHRAEMAHRVWEEMAATDSRECRNCHSLMYMDMDKQGQQARKSHSPYFARDTGKTCIDCHKGIGHQLQKGPSSSIAIP